jgi:hypothetical protein
MGISSNEFWGMTFEEIMIQVIANQENKVQDNKDRATFDYALATLFMYSNDPKKMPKIEKAYPFLKESDEVDTRATRTPTTPKWKIEQQNMLMLASQFNAKKQQENLRKGVDT